jgi:tyrosyl-tRNA synthetase
MTSPYAWHQYFLNVADADVVRYLRMFTFLEPEEIAELDRETAERPQRRAAQRRLADELTTLVHGDAATQQARAAASALFGQGELAELDAQTLDAAMAEVPTATVRLADAPTIVDLLVASGLTESKGAARRTVNEGGAYVNNVKVPDATCQPGEGDALHGKWLVLRRGKRTIAGVRLPG